MSTPQMSNTRLAAHAAAPSGRDPDLCERPSVKASVSHSTREPANVKEGRKGRNFHKRAGAAGGQRVGRESSGVSGSRRLGPLQCEAGERGGGGGESLKTQAPALGQVPGLGLRPAGGAEGFGLYLCWGGVGAGNDEVKQVLDIT